MTHARSPGALDENPKDLHKFKASLICLEFQSLAQNTNKNPNQ